MGCMHYELVEQNQDHSNVLGLGFFLFGGFFRKKAELQQSPLQIRFGTDSLCASGLGNDGQILRIRHKNKSWDIFL